MITGLGPTGVWSPRESIMQESIARGRGISDRATGALSCAASIAVASVHSSCSTSRGGAVVTARRHYGIGDYLLRPGQHLEVTPTEGI